MEIIHIRRGDERFLEAMSLRENYIVHERRWLSNERVDRIDMWNKTLHLGVIKDGKLIAYMRFYPTTQFSSMMASKEFQFCFGSKAKSYRNFLAVRRGRAVEVSRLVFASEMDRLQRRKALSLLIKEAIRISWVRNWDFWVICIDEWFFRGLKNSGVQFVESLTNYVAADGNVFVGAVVDVVKTLTDFGATAIRDGYIIPSEEALLHAS